MPKKKTGKVVKKPKPKRRTFADILAELATKQSPLVAYYCTRSTTLEQNQPEKTQFQKTN